MSPRAQSKSVRRPVSAQDLGSELAALDTSREPIPETPPPSVAKPLVFEVGWEVCWQLGGIYTVLKTKAEAMLEQYGNRYTLIGPYNPITAAGEFEEMPSHGLVDKVLDRLRKELGIGCHYGRWLVPGRPHVILLDHRTRYHRLGEDKHLMFADHGIPTPGDDAEVNDVIAFGFVTAEFFRILVEEAGGQPILAQFHEWMGGMAIPRIAHMRLPIATVFTTHATLLGRYLAGDNPQFYDHLPFFDADREAGKYGILTKHLIEKAASHACTVFTTVSQVTSFEAEKLLGRQPDRILPNGIDIERYDAPHELQHLHQQYKAQLHQFTMGHFFPSYSFDLDKTLYFFISGRYEYRNKGIDLYIEALARLNDVLKRESDAPTIVAFIVTRAPVRSINVTALQGQAQLDELARYIDRLKEQIGQRLFLNAAAGRMVGRGELIDEGAQIGLKRMIAAMKHPRQPTIATHDLIDDATDPVMNHLRGRNLLNAADDPVKLVFHPQFATATSPILRLDYDQFVRGCHLGIFPSYYEPWGYTPMECIARGIPSITSDLSGFGAYVQGTMAPESHPGLSVIKRRGKSFGESADELAEAMLSFVSLTRRQRIELRNGVERMGELFAWDTLCMHYFDAHQLAFARMGLRKGILEIKMV